MKPVTVSDKPAVVYISHAAGEDIEPIREFLEGEGFVVRDSYDLSAPEDVGEAIRFGIAHADFVIAATGSQKPNVFFELGVASGLQKPTLLLINPGGTTPNIVPHTPYVFSDLKDTEVLRLALKRFLSPDSKEPIPRVDERTQEPDRSSLQMLLAQIARARGSQSPSDIERLAGSLLRAAQVSAIEESQAGETRGVDFVIWSQSLQTSLGNPVLIEVKSGNLGGTTFRDAYNRLHAQVLRLGAGAGLLLYLDANNRRFSENEHPIPNVLAFDLEDFARELLRKSFAKIIIERRNRLAHGLV